MNKLTLLLLLGTISQSDAILLNKKELVQQTAAVVAEKPSVEKPNWNILATVVNDKEYMKSQMNVLEEQDMHNADTHNNGAQKFFEENMATENPLARESQDQKLVEVKTVANTTSNATANITANVTVAANQTVARPPTDSFIQGNVSANVTSNVSSNTTANKTKVSTFAEVNAIMVANLTANASANVTVQKNTTANSTSMATVAVVRPAAPVSFAGVKLTDKQIEIAEILQSENSQEDKKKLIDYLEDHKVTTQHIAQVDIEGESKDLSPDALVEKTVKVEEQKDMDEKIKALYVLSEDKLNLIKSLNQAVDTFSKTLSEDDWKKANKLQKELKQKSLLQESSKMQVRTTEVFEAGFQKFPQLQFNEYVQDEISYLDIAQADLNRDNDSESLLQNFLVRAKEVRKNLQNEYPSQWEAPKN